MPGGFAIRDANGQALAYVYSRLTEAEAYQAEELTTEEALQIANEIARLRSEPEPQAEAEARVDLRLVK